MMRPTTTVRGPLGRVGTACGSGVIAVLMVVLPSMFQGSPAAFAAGASSGAMSVVEAGVASSVPPSTTRGAQLIGQMQPMPSSRAAGAGSHGAGLSLDVARSGASAVQLVLTAAVASPTSNERVSFYVVTTELGGHRLVPLGSAAVGPSGAASITYQPTWTGMEQFVAQIGSDPSKPAASADRSFLVTSAVPGMGPKLTNSPKPLRQVGEDFVAVVLAVVALVWATLLATLYRVVRGTRRLATVT